MVHLHNIHYIIIHYTARKWKMENETEIILLLLIYIKLVLNETFDKTYSHSTTHYKKKKKCSLKNYTTLNT